MDDNNSAAGAATDEPKDENVYSFMMQIAQEKHGDDIDYDTLVQEANGLYDTFGEVLLAYFEPQLSEEQKLEFDQLIEGQEDQEALMVYLMDNIDNLEQKILQVLAAFRDDYLQGKSFAGNER